MKGLEPPRLAAPDPKSGAATNYATSAGSGAQKYRFFGAPTRSAAQKIRKNHFRSFLVAESDLSLAARPRGEIGKRCGLRSRWCNYLGSSSLPAGTKENQTGFPFLFSPNPQPQHREDIFTHFHNYCASMVFQPASGPVAQHFHVQGIEKQYEQF